MKRSMIACLVAVSLSSVAGAQDKAQQPSTPAPAGGMDMTKMGPGARKPTNEKQTKKEIADFFKQLEEAEKKGDMEASLAAVDFPVFMLTDDLKGVPESKLYTREEYVAMMKPMYENMPKDMKVTHKPTVVVLSDSLAAVTDEFTMTVGKQKVSGRNASLLVKVNGQWKWKSMIEAGWGGMGEGSGGSSMPSEGKK